MRAAAAPMSNYLVEWYQSGPVSLSADAAAAQLDDVSIEGVDGEPAVLMIVLTLPRDQTLFAVFRAFDVGAVVRACQRAGWPADRISSDVGAWVRAISL